MRVWSNNIIQGARLTPGYKPARNGGYTSYTGVVPDTEPIPKIQAMHRRLQRILAEMPEDYPLVFDLAYLDFKAFLDTV